MARNYSPAKDDAELLALHALKWPTAKIAEEMGFYVGDIRDALRRLGLTENLRPPLPPRDREPPPRNERPHPFNLAREHLQWRFEEKHGLFWLDGTPKPIADVMKATYAVMIRKGLNPQIPAGWEP